MLLLAHPRGLVGSRAPPAIVLAGPPTPRPWGRAATPFLRGGLNDVDGRDEPGHDGGDDADGGECPSTSAIPARRAPSSPDRPRSDGGECPRGEEACLGSACGATCRSSRIG